jgi:hypothetical protein
MGLLGDGVSPLAAFLLAILAAPFPEALLSDRRHFSIASVSPRTI